MADKELVEVANTCVIPKWPTRKGLRYEVDDFIVSPPSNEDGGFFQLRYGQRAKPRSSTYDRINQELSMTVEIKDGDPVISDVNLSGLERSISTPSLSITPTGITPAGTPEVPGEATSSHTTKPLYVFHLKGTESGQLNSEDLGKQNDSCSAIQPPDADLAESLYKGPVRKIFTRTALAEVSDTISEENLQPTTPVAEEEFLKPKVPPKRKIDLSVSLVEKVQSLKVTSPSETVPFPSPRTTPFSTPLTTPLSSPVAKRKVAGVVMDQTLKNSFFCTKPFQSSQQTSDHSFGDRGLSAASSQMSQQLESGSKVALAMDPGQKLEKKRKPKPSTLREMNFWAPTSM